MPPIWAIITLLMIGVLIPFAFRQLRGRLTAGESKIRDLIREIYGDNIVAEKIVIQGHAKVLIISLKNEPLERVQINLSSLALKHAEGASLQALRTFISLDRGSLK